MTVDLRYCPKCGEAGLQWDGEKKWSCVCGFVLFNNVAGAVAVVIRCCKELLFTRRNQDPKKGLLDLAGGFVDPKESAEFTCKRELFEELKLEVVETGLKYITSLPNTYHYKGIEYQTLDLFYEYEVQDKFDAALERSEISEALWLSKQQISTDDIAFDSQKKFLKTYLQDF